MILIAVALVALEVVVVVSASQLTGPFRLVETALYKRVAGDLRQYQIGRGSRLKTAFIRLNAQNAHLRDRLTGSIRNLKQGAKRKRAGGGKERHLYVTDAQTGASIMDARIPLFVFSFAEELQKSFLPLFVAEFHTKYDLFERDIMMGLPISTFMFVIAVFTPFAGRLVDKFGNKTLFISGLIPAIAGYLTCYFGRKCK